MFYDWSTAIYLGMDKILETPFTITRSSIMPPKNADLFRLNKNLIIYWAVVLEYIRLYRWSIFEVCRYRCEAERELYRRGKWGQGVALSHIDLNSCKHQWEEMRQFLIIGQSHLVFITYTIQPFLSNAGTLQCFWSAHMEHGILVIKTWTNGRFSGNLCQDWSRTKMCRT